jgi:hypothetical protein
MRTAAVALVCVFLLYFSDYLRRVHVSNTGKREGEIQYGDGRTRRWLSARRGHLA